MARSVRARIETRSARARLLGRKEPYWVTLERGLSAGYHKPISGGAGAWWGRARISDKYKIEAIGVLADDHVEADGTNVLNWSQAQAAIRAWAAKQTGAGPLAIEEVCRLYITDLRARKGNTAADQAEGRLRRHLLPALGTRRLADLTHSEFLAWRNGLVKGDTEENLRRSRDSANRVLGIAKAAFNLAFNSRLVADDKAWRTVRAFYNVGEARKIILDEVQQQLLIDALGPGLRELSFVGAQTGARLGELVSARVRDFDDPTSMLRLDGKTGTREIFTPPAVASLLRRLASGKRPADYLLTTAAGGRWTRSLHLHPFAVAVERAGLDPTTTFYSLRHSFISRALKAGVPTKALAEHCGTSAAMIERYYAKFIPSDLQRYAVLAAADLCLDHEDKVVALRPGGVR